MANNLSRFFPAPFPMDKSLPLLCVRSMLLHPKGHSRSEKSLLRKDRYNGHTSDALLLPYSSVSLFPHKGEYDKPEIPGSGKSSYQLPNSHCKHFRSEEITPVQDNYAIYQAPRRGHIPKDSVQSQHLKSTYCPHTLHSHPCEIESIR